ncbi:hypothetical protein [Streptomyces sp. NBC_01537]|uniref:hypothetical protein n=1 Tax=Streptomyces sp. NBC_01537 TaxID=2903896 RepID=UPI003867FBD8
MASSAAKSGADSAAAPARGLGAGGGLDGLQGGQDFSLAFVAGGRCLCQLLDRAVDAREQGLVDGELPAGQAVEQDPVEGHRGLCLDEAAVGVGQAGARLVEEIAVAVLPQLVDAVAHGRPR